MPVDLMLLLPPYFKDIREYGILMGVEASELEAAEKWIGQIKRNLYIQTCDDATLRGYERLLSIVGESGATLDYRRRMVLSRLNQQPPYTLAKLKEIMDAAVGREYYELHVRHWAYELELDLIDQSYQVLKNMQYMVEELIPAHLLFLFAGKYPVEIPVETTTASRLELASDFYARYNREYLYLDGTWPLDGTYLLNGYKEIEAMDLYPSRLTVVSGCDAPCQAETGLTIQASIRASPETETAVRIQGGAAVHTASDNRLAVTGTADAEPDTSSHLQVENDLWYLDGTYLLDGTKLLDAEIFDYDL